MELLNKMDVDQDIIWHNETSSPYSAQDIYKYCNASKSCLNDFRLDSDLLKFRFIVLGVILGVIEILGIIGNVLSIIVLSRPQMKSSISYLLLGLAVFDTLVIVNSFFVQTLGNIFPYTNYFYLYNLQLLPYITILCQPIWATSYMCSVYLILIVTIERYIAVCHPLKAKIYCSTETSKKSIYLITILAIIYQMPMCFENNVITEHHSECDLTINCMSFTEFGTNQVFIVIYWEYMHSLFISFLPLASLAFFNLCILREIKRTNKHREEMSAVLKNEIDLAKMLLRIVFIFFICNIIFPILHFTRYFITDNSLIAWPIMKDIGRCLIVVNSCVNFIMYVASGTKFKTVFLQIFWNPVILSNDSNSIELNMKKTQKI